MMNYKDQIIKENVPAHVAIIMDGNGRWAEQKALPRIEGHRRGSDAIEPLMDAALELGIKAVSLYAFSTENWLRPPSEIKGLWGLLEYFFEKKIGKIMEKGICIRHSGNLHKIPGRTQKVIRDAIELTRKNKNIILNFCINYGGRQEIVESVNEWLDRRGPHERLTIQKLEKCLYTNGLPELDLMIRTSGEYRISNFLLWQIAYSELVFMDVLWPDFKPAYLYKAIYEFQQRKRRFGGL